MYSGNHSACHPLDTLLTAALTLQSEERIVFCFVGGGSEFHKVKDFARNNSLSNILCLPYQPRSQLAGSLSAADLHVVIMGERFKGLVHPCKVYNIIAIGAPFLYIGPEESHVSDLLKRYPAQMQARTAHHGDIGCVVAHIRAAAAAATLHISPSNELMSLVSSESLIPRMIAIVKQPFEDGAATSEEQHVVCTPTETAQTEIHQL